MCGWEAAVGTYLAIGDTDAGRTALLLLATPLLAAVRARPLPPLTAGRSALAKDDVDIVVRVVTMSPVDRGRYKQQTEAVAVVEEATRLSNDKQDSE